MALRVAFQMDPIEAVDIAGDSTFRLALEAQARGHAVSVYTPDRLSYRDGRVIARLQAAQLRATAGAHVTLGPPTDTDLSDLDVVWLRQDPPFDMGYITSTHLLEMVHPDTLVVNDPFWVRNHPEKLLVLQFPQLTPPTLITRELDAIRAFKDRHGDVILKPLYGNGGAGVFRLGRDDHNLSSLHELFTTINREPLIVQKYLPAVTRGDKRIILVDGAPIGAINRVPAEGETRSNMHVGGRAEQVALCPRDHEICDRIGPLLRAHGQIFVGIDVIGDWLTEINVTSPTGLMELERFDGTNGAALIWQAIEDKRAG